jgi:hypothetical protein
MSNLFATLQNAVAQRIESADWLGGATPPVKVVTEAAGSIDTEIEKRIAAKGLGVIVSTPEFSRRDADFREGLDFVLGVTLLEAPKINRGPSGTQKRYDDAALEITALLEGFAPAPGWLPLAFKSGTLVEASADLVEYELTFETATRAEAVEE